MSNIGPSCERRPSFHQQLGAKTNLHFRECGMPLRRNGNFMAPSSSILDQIALVPKTDRTGPLLKFAFGSPLTLLV